MEGMKDTHKILNVLIIYMRRFLRNTYNIYIALKNGG